jgi:hypothetical protein
MSAEDEKHDWLIKHLEEYATKADADYETATKIFDLRWNTTYRRLNELVHSSQQALDPAAENADETLRRAIVTRRQMEIYFATIKARNAANTPPKIAEFCLAALLSGVKADAIIGDLNERFQHDLKRYGVRRARHLYSARAIKSLWPLFRRAVARVIKVGIFAEIARRFF